MAKSQTQVEPQVPEPDAQAVNALRDDISGIPVAEPGLEAEKAEMTEETPLQKNEDSPATTQAQTSKTGSKKHLKVKKANIKKSKSKKSTAKKKTIKKSRAKKSKGKKTPPRQPDVSSGQEDAPAGPNTATKSVEPKEPETVEGSTGEELKQEQPTVEEKSAEAANEAEIQEQSQAGQVQEEPADSENAAGRKSNAEESQPRQQDVSPDPEDAPVPETVQDAVAGPNVTADSVNPKEPETVEESTGEELKQQQPTVEEKPDEAANEAEIQEQAQAEQVTEEPADSENATDRKSNTEESQPRQQNVSSDREDAPVPETVESDAADSNAADSVTEDQTTATETSDNPKMGEVSEAIRKLIQSTVLQEKSQPAENSTQNAIGNLLKICASDIMQSRLTWASPEDSLQQAFAKMQQTDAGYIMIGQHGVLEGIVSKSDITKAMSPYLLPIFAKWRRPLDDATLKIRIRWIMSRPVRTIKPETPLATIMEDMSQFRGRCMPVMDEKGKVQGLVTAFDIFRALLKSNTNACSEEDRTAEEPVESASPNETA